MHGIDEFRPASRGLAITTIALGTSISTLANTITSIALPTMAHDLGASPSSSIWIVNAYQLVVTVGLLPLASLGDIYGYRIVYLSGLCLFTFASFCCGLADSLPLLVACRAAQALGAAGIMSVNSALVRLVFPPERLGAGMSVMTLTVAVCSAAGPSIAAAILSVASWQWLFLANVPLGLAAILLAWHSAPRNVPAGHRFDKISAILNALTFGFLLFGFDGLAHGAEPIVIATELGVGALAGFAFIRRQKKSDGPNVAGGFISSSRVRALDRYLDLFLCRANHSPDLAPVLFSDRRWGFAIHGRTDADTVARGHHDRRTGFWTPIRSLSSGPLVRPGPRDSDGWPVADAPNPSRRTARRCRMAHGDLRNWVRFLSVAQRPSDRRRGPAKPKRRRQRHDVNRASDRPNNRGSDGRDDFCLHPRRYRNRIPARADGGDTCLRGGVCPEFPEAAVTDAPLRPPPPTAWADRSRYE